MSLGWGSIQVANAVAAGSTLDEAVELANDLSTRGVFIGMVDTLEL